MLAETAGAANRGRLAFFLALMPNSARYVPGFLRRSLGFALPAGAIIALALTAYALAALGLGATGPQLSQLDAEDRQDLGVGTGDTCDLGLELENRLAGPNQFGSDAARLRRPRHRIGRLGYHSYLEHCQAAKNPPQPDPSPVETPIPFLYQKIS